MTDERSRPRWRRLLRATWFTPAGLLVRAGLTAGTFLLVHAAGLRDAVALLSGSATASAPPGPGTAAAAALYLAAYFALVLGTPILGLAAAFLGIANAVMRRGDRPRAGLKSH